MHCLSCAYSHSFILPFQVVDDLAVFCISLCRIVDPEVIVFGGGMSLAGEDLLTPIREAIKRRTWTELPTDVVIAAAKNKGGNGGILGAALSAKMLSQDHRAVSSIGESTSESNTTNTNNYELTLQSVVTGVLSAGLASSIFAAIVKGGCSRRISASSHASTTGAQSSGGCCRCPGAGQYAPLVAHILLVGVHIALLSNWRKKF
jgi:hypothetical protein